PHTGRRCDGRRSRKAVRRRGTRGGVPRRSYADGRLAARRPRRHARVARPRDARPRTFVPVALLHGLSVRPLAGRFAPIGLRAPDPPRRPEMVPSPRARPRPTRRGTPPSPPPQAGRTA